MELELQALRIQLADKSKHSLQLQKEVFLLLHQFPNFDLLAISQNLVAIFTEVVFLLLNLRTQFCRNYR